MECRARHVYGLVGDVGARVAVALNPLELGSSLGEDFGFGQICEVASRVLDARALQHRTLGS